MIGTFHDGFITGVEAAVFGLLCGFWFLHLVTTAQADDAAPGDRE